MSDEKIIVALYTRVSTQEQAKDGYSIGEQKERLTKYAESMDWIVYEVYSDPGFSGAKLDRPGIQNLITDAENKKFKKVVVYKLDRLSRSQKDTLYLIEDVFMAHDIDFISMTESFDTATPFGKAMVGMLSVFAQFEREQIRERMTIGREGRTKEGLWSGGPRPPIGYRYKDGQLIIDPYEGEIVKRIYREYLSGKTINSIVRDLNNEGIRNIYGEYTNLSVRRILKNSVYGGYVHFGNTVAPGQHDPLVSVEDWKKASAMVQKMAQEDQSHLSFTSRTCLIAGLCYCGECGQKMISRYWKKDDGTVIKNFVCPDKGKTGCKSKPYRREEIEKVVLSQVKRLRLDPKFLKKSRTKTDSKKIDKTIKIYTDKIESNKRKISRYMDLYAIGGIDLEDLNGKIASASKENESLTREIADLKNSDDYPKTDQEITDDVVRMEDFIDDGNVELARRIITKLIDKIVLTGSQVEIFWNF